MDIDVFPNSVEYWGPTGMAFFRNVQVRWMPIQGDTRLTIALERPGASGDQGVLRGSHRADGRQGALSAARTSRPSTAWAATGATSRSPASCARSSGTTPTRHAIDLSGDATGWGINLSSNLKFGNGTCSALGVVYGEGIQNYMNDAPGGHRCEVDPGDPITS